MSTPHRASLTPAEILSEKPYLNGLGKRLVSISAIIGGLGLALSLGLGALAGDGFKHFSFSYLVAYVFFLSISLGALCLVPLQYVSRATSSVVLRRLAELLATGVAVLAVLALPLLVPVATGTSPLYSWLHPAAHDAVLAAKAPFLNPAFFIIRFVIYFGVWIALAFTFFRRSVTQDQSGDPQITRRQWQLSAPGLVLYALTITFAMADLVMSLDAHWYSTIIGVYFFSGCMVAVMAALTLCVMLLQKSGRLRRAVTVEHYHDLGKLLFAFLFFWGYIAFSQFMLMWYANLPEETAWYVLRESGPWLWWFVALGVVHFGLPFVGLLPRGSKRRKRVLAFFAVWMLVAHYIDLYWLVMPQFSADTLPLHLLDLTTLLGLGGLWFAAIAWLARTVSLVPLKDPALADSLRFENV